MKLFVVQLLSGEFIHKSHIIDINLPLVTTTKIEDAKQWRSRATALNFINNSSYKRMLKRDKMEVKILEIEVTYTIKEQK